MFKVPWYICNAIVKQGQDSPNDGIISVYIPDVLPFASGDLLKKSEKVSSIELKDLNGNPIKKDITSTTFITARYYNSDNKSIPDVVPGERVVVFQYAKQGPFYWSIAGIDRSLRKTEHLRHSVSDKMTKMEELNDDNTYYYEFNTDKDVQHFVISTSDSCGEKFRYLIKIDAKNRSIILQDNDSNRIQLDSDNEHIILENKSTSKVELTRQDILIFAPNNIRIVAGNNIDMVSTNTTTFINKDTIHTTAKSIITTSTDNITTAVNITATAASTSTSTPSSIVMTAKDNVDIIAKDATTTTLNSIVDTAGVSISVNAPTINVGAATALNMVGTTGDIVIAKVSHVSHIHSNGHDGNNTGGPVTA